MTPNATELHLDAPQTTFGKPRACPSRVEFLGLWSCAFVIWTSLVLQMEVLLGEDGL